MQVAGLSRRERIVVADRDRPRGAARLPELTLAEFVDLYLERHAVTVRGRTIAILRGRLR
jgi:hypothetical protein